MKHDLKKLEQREQQKVLEALFRLKRNSRDFEVVQDYMKYCLETRKKDLINVPLEEVAKLQGESLILSDFFSLLELAETEGSK